MGTGIEMKCNRCHYRPSFSLGIGMQFYPENIFSENLDNTMLEELLENEEEFSRFQRAAQNGGELQQNYGYKIYQCLECNNIENYFFLEVQLSDTSIVPEYHCGVCQKPFMEVQLDSGVQKELGCPVCEEGRLDTTDTYLWD